MAIIKKIIGRQILDSRGNPTLEIDIHLEKTGFGRAAVPSGASTGSKEALELRDGEGPYQGKGVKKRLLALRNLEKSLVNQEFRSQKEFDDKLISLDATPNKSNLGANLILGLSLAFAKARSDALGKLLCKYIAEECLQSDPARDWGMLLPRPMFNVINGGAHADNNLAIQEFMIMPQFEDIEDNLIAAHEIIYQLRSILKSLGHSTNVGDEGGFAPNLSSNEEALDILARAVSKSQYKLDSEIKLCLDVAANEIYHDGYYQFDPADLSKKLTSMEVVNYYDELCRRFPIFSIEDGMAEEDYQGWQLLTKSLGSKIQLVGDDLFVTNPKILQMGIEQGYANAILIKLNQIGTLSETLDAIKLAQQNGYKCIISHRSGETEDTTIAHLAVAIKDAQLKTGSLCRTDRVAKYNELLRIKQYLSSKS